MGRRAGVLGGAFGVVAAGAAAVVAVDRASAGRRRAAARLATGEFAPLPADRTGRVITDDGVALYYEEVGPRDAPLTVVLGHGFCLTMDSFWFQRRDLVERFGDGIRLVCYDQRSHGRSSHAPDGSVTVDRLGTDLAEVLASVAPNGPLVLAGHSMGGMTLLALAMQHPRLVEERVSGLALISSSAGDLGSLTLGLPSLLARVAVPLLPVVMRGARTQPRLVERTRALGADISWAITKRLSFVSEDVDPATVEFLSAMIARTPIDVVADFYDALLHHDKTAVLPRLTTVPTLVVCGDHDLLTPLEHSERIAAALPDARLVVVPGTGHMALMEKPDLVSEPLGDLVAASLPSARRRPGRWWQAS